MTRPMDPGVWALFQEEMSRHTESFRRRGTDLVAIARSLHSMRGAAAMMGLGELAQALGEAERAARRGDAGGTVAGLRGLGAAFQAAGLELEVPVPEDLATAGSIPPPREAGERSSEELELMGYFLTDARQRLGRVASALGALRAGDGAREAFDAALRELHALKGSAGLVGVTEVARGAHAMEGALGALKARGGRATGGEVDALSAARDRLVLSLGGARGGAREVDELVALLRASGLLRERDLPGPRSAREEQPARGSELVRVPTSAVRGLTEAVGEVGFVGERLARHAGFLQDVARELQGSARGVSEALRRIGPARPWGAPMEALSGLVAVQRVLGQGARALEQEADELRDDTALLESLTGTARSALGKMGAVTAGWLFDRVAPAVESAAAAEDKSVRVAREGDEVEVDRAVAEGLLEPLTQLARNAVAHGVERPTARLARGKPLRATVRLAASLAGDGLRLEVEDDGAGVDVSAVRARASALGLLPRERRPTEAELFEAMFFPGFSTRASADGAAGRGVGLDLVRREVGALGGAVKVWSRAGVGARFTLELVPRALVERVVCVSAGSGRVALPLARVSRVCFGWEAPRELPRLPLASLFSEGRSRTERGQGFLVVLASSRGEVAVLVDEVEAPREIAVRRLPPLVAGVAPWGAAAISGEGVVTLVADPDGLHVLATRGPELSGKR